MYNIAPGKGMHPFKALYSIIIMPEFAFFTLGIVANGWHFS